MDNTEKLQPTICKPNNELDEDRDLRGDFLADSNSTEVDIDSAGVVVSNSTQEPAAPSFDETLPMSLEEMSPVTNR